MEIFLRCFYRCSRRKKWPRLFWNSPHLRRPPVCGSSEPKSGFSSSFCRSPRSRWGGKRGVRRSVKMETGIKRFGFGVRRREGAFWRREWFPRAGGREGEIPRWASTEKSPKSPKILEKFVTEPSGESVTSDLTCSLESCGIGTPGARSKTGESPLRQ